MRLTKLFEILATPDNCSSLESYVRSEIEKLPNVEVLVGEETGNMYITRKSPQENPQYMPLLVCPLDSNLLESEHHSSLRFDLGLWVAYDANKPSWVQRMQLGALKSGIFMVYRILKDTSIPVKIILTPNHYKGYEGLTRLMGMDNVSFVVSLDGVGSQKLYTKSMNSPIASPLFEKDLKKLVCDKELRHWKIADTDEETCAYTMKERGLKVSAVSLAIGVEELDTNNECLFEHHMYDALNVLKKILTLKALYPHAVKMLKS